MSAHCCCCCHPPPIPYSEKEAKKAAKKAEKEAKKAEKEAKKKEREESLAAKAAEEDAQVSALLSATRMPCSGKDVRQQRDVLESGFLVVSVISARRVIG